MFLLFLDNGQPRQSFLQLNPTSKHRNQESVYGEPMSYLPISRMTDGIHVRVQTSDGLASTSWNHCDSRCQQGLVPKRTNERQYSVWRPSWKRKTISFYSFTAERLLTSNEEETYRDSRLCNSQLGRRSVPLDIRSQ